MVLEFLQSLQEKFTSEKFDKKEELDFIGTKIRETEKFIHLLESENEQPFSDFTPRTVNSKNQNRLNELNQALSDYQSQRDQIVSEIDELERWLSDIRLSIDEVRGMDGSTVPVSHTSDSSGTPNPEGMEVLVKQLNKINHFLPVDSMRAKLELTKLISKIS